MLSRTLAATRLLLSSSTTSPVVTALLRHPTANWLLARSTSTRHSTSTVRLQCETDLCILLTTPAIVAIIKKYPKVAISLIIEPDSLPNLVTNINLAPCQASAAGYREGVAYALKQLNLPNVAMYLDAGHGGWLGWNDNLSTSAEPCLLSH